MERERERESLHIFIFFIFTTRESWGIAYFLELPSNKKMLYFIFFSQGKELDLFVYFIIYKFWMPWVNLINHNHQKALNPTHLFSFLIIL